MLEYYWYKKYQRATALYNSLLVDVRELLDTETIKKNKKVQVALFWVQKRLVLGTDTIQPDRYAVFNAIARPDSIKAPYFEGYVIKMKALDLYLPDTGAAPKKNMTPTTIADRKPRILSAKRHALAALREWLKVTEFPQTYNEDTMEVVPVTFIMVPTEKMKNDLVRSELSEMTGLDWT